MIILKVKKQIKILVTEKLVIYWWVTFFIVTLDILFSGQVFSSDVERIRISKDNFSFILEKSERAFIPWGFNYDHDEKGRLIEDYWGNEWDKVEEDFQEMKELSANVVRIHLQLGKFMLSPEKPNKSALRQLKKVLILAKKLNLRLDITGLGCYLKQYVPDWYDKLGEKERWNVQAKFWEAIAKVCANNPVIFCYDLMNEPVVPVDKRESGNWLGGDFAGYYYVQFITLNQENRPRQEIARQWIRQLKTAIRKYDTRSFITVGMLPSSMKNNEFNSGFNPKEIGDELDIICVHIYPKSGELQKSMETLREYSVGKPIVIEEMFPLNCSINDLGKFIDDSKQFASGRIGFYWGKKPEEYNGSKEIADILTLDWLRLFEKKAKTFAKNEF